MSDPDWRSKCTPIKDQGNCGSCTVFGTIGAWEAIINIQDSVEYDLSERDLFACSGGKCSYGNYMEPVFERAVKGVSTETCCPYHDWDIPCGGERCENWWDTGAKLKSWRLLHSHDEMKQELRKGPIVATMAVYQSFIHYKSGVYHRLPTWDPLAGYHAICLVGYSDEKEAWLLRNSWGVDWGLQGYCWIKFGDSEIEDETYAIVPDGEIEPFPEPEPTCPVSITIKALFGMRTLRALRKVRDWLVRK